MVNKPEPPISPDVDLRGMPFMPLDVNRLRDSDLAIEATGEEFRAAVMLWCASWNQVPAGSLPNSDTALAAYAGFGRDIKGWKKVKDGALRGFIECSDDRLYHSVVTEKAMCAWAERVEYREIKDNEKSRKQREREDRKRMFEALRSVGIVLPYNVTTSELRSQYDSIKPDEEAVTGHEHVTVTGHALDTAKRGTGTGTGTGIKDQEHTHTAQTKFSLHDAWEPNPTTFTAVLFRNGMASQTFEADQLLEFRSYWISRPDDLKTQAQWEHALAQQLKRQARTQQANGGSPNETGRRIAQSRTRNAHDILTDDTW
ncbi:DnaT-like ssDNA-binding domain-containing protein [Pseudomonas sp. 681]|uniref:DnaT-like ssDNA-binding domain-containing protein n=1 Tax=Pseudomonas fungipugnans TaxID=3024217 RepID=A0ABT6QVQ7_9PSED|nr:DnaT-like ssDNA-binding domain-containing protein [Pseudomonas sp. 681]MDI2595002.1 DnaT-like ssDNA-binding domain-containing protein [Pseudomonas sp. 681]